MIVMTLGLYGTTSRLRRRSMSPPVTRSPPHPELVKLHLQRRVARHHVSLYHHGVVALVGDAFALEQHVIPIMQVEIVLLGACTPQGAK
jgi:hypothetical protein